jgi:DNA-binding SARP family transcriptional activator
LMRALAMSGRLDDALAQFESCRLTLARELGSVPAAETGVLYQQIRDNLAAGLSSLPPIAAQEPP